MIERYHFLKLKPECATAAERDALVRRATAELAAVPGVVRVTAGVPGDADTLRAWDVSIVVRFATPADVEAYRPHPVHRRFVDEYVAPRVEMRRGWTFEVTDGVAP